MVIMDFNLSREKALTFLKDRLKLNIEEVDEIMKDRTPRKERLNLLNSIIHAFYQHIPFQNIVFLAMPQYARKVPTVGSIIDEVSEGRGGMCYVNNVFFKLLLESIGYQVWLVSGQVSGQVKNPGDHAITIVKGIVTVEDIYLAEVGAGYPTLEAIPLYFECESPIYHHSYIKSKYIKTSRRVNDDDGIIERWNFSVHRNEWWKYYEFSLKPRDVSFFEAPMSGMDKVHTVPTMSNFHDTILLNSFTNGHAITIKNYDFYEEGLQGGVVRHVLPHDDVKSYVEFVGRYFPQLNDFLPKALENVGCGQ